ncbi:MAG TPA: hypothetical protein PK466_00700 [Thermotogota bacterium]|nr:hypothetical protein [Thermotogota bacterium]HPJ87613.1 hypothetical protein [Thermotogota bacterium]HPR94818.1 hypothetical protein [Thermotogota bacterium]
MTRVKITMFLILTFMVISTFSAMIATTDDGRKVVLNSNGTWEWVNNPSPVTPSVQLAYDITGSWKISWTVGIFDEEVDAEIYLQDGNYVMIWHGTFSDDKNPITIIDQKEIKFQGKSFHNGTLTFDASLKDANNMSGMASSSGTFAKTGSFTAKRK